MLRIANVLRKPRLRRWARRWGWFGLLLVMLPGIGRLPWGEMGAVLHRLSPEAWGGLVVLNAAFVFVSVARWRVLLRALTPRRPAWGRLLRYRLAGFAVSYFTPGTQVGGEPLQVWALQAQDDVPLAAAAVSVALDRLLDFSANLLFFGLAAWVLAHQRVHLAARSESWLVLALGVSLAWAGLCVQPWSPTKGGWRGMVAQAAHLCRHRPAALAAAAGLSALAWGLLVAEYRWMLWSLGLQPTWTQTLTMMVAARLAFWTPLPAGVGALEVGQVWAARFLGWPSAVGLALSLLIRARDVLVGGLGLLFARGLWSRRPATTTPTTIMPSEG